MDTIRQEVELIHDSGLPRPVQAELLGVAFLVALRAFARDIVVSIFREDEEMMNEVEEAVRDLFGETTYFKKLKAEGKEEATRAMTLRFLARRFGVLPETIVKQIEAADAAWCQDLFDHAINVVSLAELFPE